MMGSPAAFGNQQIIDRYSPLIGSETVAFLNRAVERIVAAKQKGGKVG